MQGWAILAGLVVAHQLLVETTQRAERDTLWRAAYAVSRASGKPMLLVGRPSWGLDYPCSPDVTLDLDPAIGGTCPMGGIEADVRAIPFPDKHFGACLLSHVLEHVGSAESIRLAWREVWRVSDVVFVAYPRKSAILAWTNRDHRAWVTPLGPGVLEIEERCCEHRHVLVLADGRVVPAGAATPYPLLPPNFT